MNECPPNGSHNQQNTLPVHRSESLSLLEAAALEGPLSTLACRESLTSPPSLTLPVKTTHPTRPTPGAATLRSISQETKLRTWGQAAAYQSLPLEAAVPGQGYSVSTEETELPRGHSGSLNP